MLEEDRAKGEKIVIEKKFADPGAVEDIQELKVKFQEPKSGPILGNGNQVNTAGATSSKPDIRE
ncbi:hypothetical protein [Thermotalea metallivorans]|uniref:Uncharacterized protein n=1 Tax=Thermotalea metallivorans TaxID=520762 RepID=A0A140L5A9_9FIRM|nr:hypothetical protein [Thermotalea metallivorans]KXG75734.1 hypothetical protein AN619_14880 [Thermotalea metallivorans]